MFQKMSGLIVIILLILLITAGCLDSRQSPSPSFLATIKPVANDTYWITLDPVQGYPTYEYGVNIHARTNLPAGKDLFIRIYDRTNDGKRYSRTELTTVMKGDNLSNNISYRVNSNTIQAGDYTAIISAGEKGPANVSNFTIWPTP